MVQFKLCIQDENENNLFYNAVGGKNAGRIIKVVLLETSTQRMITDQVVKLSISLTYENGLFVNNQEICRTLKNTSLIIDQNTPAVINFRIDEVSSHHQGQLFRLLISPVMDTEENNYNNNSSTIHASHIESVFSDPIEVRSKVVFTKKVKKLSSSHDSSVSLSTEDESIIHDDDNGDVISLSTSNTNVPNANINTTTKCHHNKVTSIKKSKSSSSSTCSAITDAVIPISATSTSLPLTHKVSFDDHSTTTTTINPAASVVIINDRLGSSNHHHHHHNVNSNNNLASVSCDDDMNQLEASISYLLPFAHTIKDTLLTTTTTATSTDNTMKISKSTSSSFSTSIVNMKSAVAQSAAVLVEQMESLAHVIRQNRNSNHPSSQPSQHQQQSLLQVDEDMINKVMSEQGGKISVDDEVIMMIECNNNNNNNSQNNWEELFSRQNTNSSNIINHDDNQAHDDIVIINDDVFNSTFTSFMNPSSLPLSLPTTTIVTTLHPTITTTNNNHMNKMNNDDDDDDDMISKPMLCRGFSASWEAEFPYNDDNNHHLFRCISNIIADNDESDVELMTATTTNNNDNNSNNYSVVGQKRKYYSNNHNNHTAPHYTANAIAVYTTTDNNNNSSNDHDDDIVPLTRLSRQSSFTTVIIESILGVDYIS